MQSLMSKGESYADLSWIKLWNVEPLQLQDQMWPVLRIFGEQIAKELNSKANFSELDQKIFYIFGQLRWEDWPS